MLLPLLAALSLTQQPSEGFDAETRIKDAVAVVRPVAYRSRQVDWDALTEDLRNRANGARDDIDMLPAWAAMAHGLGDGHSFVQPTPEAIAAWRERYGDRPLLPDAPPRPRPGSPFMKRAEIEARTLAVGLDHDAELITVPSVSGFGEKAVAYASRLFGAVADAGPRTCGYVLDLRGNTGGNVWPMLIGLSGLLGDGPQGRSEDADGLVEDYATLKEGSAVVLAEQARDLTMMTIGNWRPIPSLAAAPVALLLDDATASSGEGVAVAFAGRAFTRSFGARTYGVASSNEGYPLADGTNVVVTTAMMMDRNGRTYPEGIEPDQVIDGEGEDPVDAARTWLALQPACK
jgi:C-terminal processing protease CtpA/Prc